MRRRTEVATNIAARVRVLVSVAVGLVVGLGVGLGGAWLYAPLAAWDSVTIVFGVWLWLQLWPLNAKGTESHAGREDPSRIWADVVLILASVASLVAVGVVIVDASSATGVARALPITLAIASVVLSWAMVHTIYALRYAKVYYDRPRGGIDFNGKDDPTYSDFAYLAFTIGMTFQVSDTSFQTETLRRIALRHSLLAYLFGTVIVATTINLIAGLGR